jgi:hypothetical protein
MYIFVRICKFNSFEQKSNFKKNVIAIAIAQNVPLYGQTLNTLLTDIICILVGKKGLVHRFYLVL